MRGDFDWAAIYATRRRALMDQMVDGIAVIESSGGSPDPLLFDKNLRHLVGPTPRDSVLVLAPNGLIIDRLDTIHGPEVGRGRQVHEILFVRGLTAKEKKMDGDGAQDDEIRDQSSVDAVKPLTQLEPILCAALMEHDALWINVGGVPNLQQPPPPGQLLVQKIQQRLPWIRFRKHRPLDLPYALGERPVRDRLSSNGL